MSYKVENTEYSFKAEWTGEKPEYTELIVSEDLTLKFDLDDTWIAIKDTLGDECNCVMVGLNEIDSLILQLQQAKELLGEQR